MEKKYTDVIIDDKTRYRIFNEDVDDRELLWHQDKKDRVVRVLGGKDWAIQFDNELPTVLEEGKEYKISNHTFHRIIKGKGDLVVKITEK